MLRELENQRKNRRDQEENKETPPVAKQHSGKPEKKTSVERMIEDFHRNLPHPAAAKEPDGRSTATNTVNSKRNGALVNGTMTSQMSNWSAGSSVASFDYHQVGKSGIRYLDNHESNSCTSNPPLWWRLNRVNHSATSIETWGTGLERSYFTNYLPYVFCCFNSVLTCYRVRRIISSGAPASAGRTRRRGSCPRCPRWTARASPRLPPKASGSTPREPPRNLPFLISRAGHTFNALR